MLDRVTVKARSLDVEMGHDKDCIILIVFSCLLASIERVARKTLWFLSKGPTIVTACKATTFGQDVFFILQLSVTQTRP